ncbi:hypothetical protein [Corynebacterium lubricantis]|uniref:hypothetical protein n=1 Tax=Corynebacterium lubricantis TaxID=541095 RepID=UPI00037D586B|nr:hypothetical protein [Corynebacterium lubricantis]
MNTSTNPARTSAINLDPAQSAVLIDSLRLDAAGLPSAPEIALPGIGPLARISHALTLAWQHYNAQSAQVHDRTHFHADEMTTLTHQAMACDDTLGQQLQGLAP